MSRYVGPEISSSIKTRIYRFPLEKVAIAITWWKYHFLNNKIVIASNLKSCQNTHAACCIIYNVTKMFILYLRLVLDLIATFHRWWQMPVEEVFCEDWWAFAATFVRAWWSYCHYCRSVNFKGKAAAWSRPILDRALPPTEST